METDSKPQAEKTPVSPIMSLSNRDAPTPNTEDKKTFSGKVKGISEDYNPYLIPANLGIAQFHGRANLAGNILNIFDPRDEQLIEKNKKLCDRINEQKSTNCPCCGHSDNQMMASLLTRSGDMSRLGTAIPGFFDFSKYIILTMVLTLLAYSIYSFVHYTKSDDCGYKDDNNKDLRCGAKWKFFMSSASFQSGQLDVTERILYIVAMVLIYSTKVYYYRKLRKLDAQSDEAVTDITDYSVELRGLPQDVTKKEIKQWFANQPLIDESGNPVTAKAQIINFVFSDADKVQAWDSELKLDIAKFVQASKNNDPNVDELEEKIKIKLADAQKILHEEYFSNTTERKHNSKNTGIAFVSFQTQDQAETVSQRLAVKGFGKMIYKAFGTIGGPFSVFSKKNRHLLRNDDQNSHFYIEKAEKPSEILFQNMGLGLMNRSLRKTFSFICSIVMIIVTAIIIFVLKGQEGGLKYSNTKSKGTSSLLIGITVLIKVACAILEFVTPTLVDFEKPETFTIRNIGMIWRSTISVFVNSALVVVVANIYYLEDKLDDTFYTDKGLANDLLLLLIFGCLETVFSIINPAFGYTLFRRYMLKKNITTSVMPQYQANDLFEGQLWVYPRRFGKYCNAIMLTFFIVSIFPYAPLIGIANVCLFLCADRFFLLRLSKLPEYCSSELVLSMLRFSDMIFVVWAAGYMVLEKITLNDGISNWSIVTMALAGANMIFNPNYILRKIFKFHAENEADNANTDLRKFLHTAKKPETYKNRNPINILGTRIKMYMNPVYIQGLRRNLHDLSIDSASEDNSVQSDVIEAQLAEIDHELDEGFTPMNLHSQENMNFERNLPQSPNMKTKADINQRDINVQLNKEEVALKDTHV